jgi:hypothetical protein
MAYKTGEIYFNMTIVVNIPVWLSMYLKTNRTDDIDQGLFSILQKIQENM